MEMNRDEKWMDARMSALTPDPDWAPDAVRARARVRDVAAGSSRRRVVFGIAGAAAVGSAALFPPARAVARQCVDACAALFDPGTNGAPLGSLAPDFASEDAHGARFHFSDYRGKVVLVNFWATWCPPCRAEMPWFDEFEQAWSSRGFAAVGVSLDERGWETVRPVLAANGVRYRIAIGGDDAASRFGVASLPTTLLIGRDGRVAARWTGVVPKSEYEAAIQKAVSR